jgi:hypothetical protein
MSEGRDGLQRVIQQYEKQLADAIRSRQECEIVLPFLRGALEELDATLGNSEDGEVMERVQSEIRSSTTRTREIRAESAAEGSADATSSETSEPAHARPASPSFNRASIASLIDEADQQEKAS